MPFTTKYPVKQRVPSQKIHTFMSGNCYHIGIQSISTWISNRICGRRCPIYSIIHDAFMLEIDKYHMWKRNHSKDLHNNVKITLPKPFIQSLVFKEILNVANITVFTPCFFILFRNMLLLLYYRHIYFKSNQNTCDTRWRFMWKDSAVLCIQSPNVKQEKHTLEYGLYCTASTVWQVIKVIFLIK